jgi:hypothetical protein
MTPKAGWSMVGSEEKSAILFRASVFVNARKALRRRSEGYIVAGDAKIVDREKKLYFFYLRPTL